MNDRILFIDVLRGIGILGVLLSHAALYGIYKTPENALTVLPETAIIFLSPIIILITWTGLFALITGLVNAFTVYKRLERGIDLNKALTGPLINAILVYALHLIYRATFNHRSTGMKGEELHSLITGWVETGHPVKLYLIDFYLTEAFHMIAVTGFFTTFLLWLLWRNDGHKKHSRNFKILLVLSVVWLILYSPAFNLGYPYYVKWFYMGSPFLYIVTFFMKTFWGGMQVLFPYGAFGAIGMIYGIWFAQKAPFSTMYKFSNIFGVILVFSGICKLLIDFLVLKKTLIELLEFHNLPPFLTWFNLGTMLLFISWLIWKMEDRTLEERVIIAKKTIWIRQFGILALTVFFFESFVHAVFARIFHAIFGDPDPTVMKDNFMFNPWAIILYIFTIYVFWFVTLWLLGKTRYKYSMEHLFVKIGSKLRKVKSTRANLYQILVDPLGIQNIKTSKNNKG